MKNIYIFAILLFVSIGFGQGKKSSFDELVESEMKSAAQYTNLTVNPNTQNYDVTYHKLEITVNPSVYSLSAKVTTTFTALSNMNTVTFDFSKITNTSDPNYANRIIVSAVKQNGVNLTFSHNITNELVINLPSTLTIGNSTSVEITYAGAPANSGFGSFVKSQHNNVNIIWTLSEPFGAMDWWPCKQDLNDKINSVDIYIKAPSQFISASNGIEPEPPVISGLSKTTHFQHNYLIPAYLICFAVTNYTVINQVGGTAPNTYPIKNY
jgi:aminopeptidase N